MYFRVTTYGFDAARFDEFLALADTFRDELNAIDGLETVHSCVVEEGQGMIISRYASEAAAEEAGTPMAFNPQEQPVKLVDLTGQHHEVFLARRTVQVGSTPRSG